MGVSSLRSQRYALLSNLAQHWTGQHWRAPEPRDPSGPPHFASFAPDAALLEDATSSKRIVGRHRVTAAACFVSGGNTCYDGQIHLHAHDATVSCVCPSGASS
jgi:hypothetical protein